MIHHTETPITKIKVIIDDIKRTCFDLNGNDMYKQYNKECHEIADLKHKEDIIKNKPLVSIFSYDEYITRIEKQKVNYLIKKLYEKQYPAILKDDILTISLNANSLKKLIIDLGI